MAGRQRARLGPRKKPSQARSRVTVGVILEAAARIFAEHGYGGGTTNRIAVRAGVSIGSLYEYFPNKEAILVALVEQHMAEGAALLGELLGAPPEGDLRALVRRFVAAMVRLHARDPKLHRVLFEEAPLPEGLRTRLLELERALAVGVEQMFSAHAEVKVGDTALAARLLVKTVEALTHDFVLHPYDGEQDEERYVDEVSALVTRYLCAGEP